MKERRLVAEKAAMKEKAAAQPQKPEFMGGADAATPAFSVGSSQKKSAAERIGYRRPR